MAERKPIIVAVDDDTHLLDLIEHHVVGWGCRFKGATGAEQMWKVLDEVMPNLILLDIQLGDDDGTDLLAPLKERFAEVPIIMITAHGTIERAVKSIKAGAFDFLTKPLDFERLQIECEKALQHHQLQVKVKSLTSAESANDFYGMVGTSPAMGEVYERIRLVGPTDAAALVLGETGVGKELIARAIHQCSDRVTGAFVPVNAAAIPHELIESALFGHEKGAFTGADRTYDGLCRQADGGTLFLDEICEMDYNVQAKLLRFLQDHIVQPVGSSERHTVDVRVVAATNRDPAKQIEAGQLREDFYYRLSMITISAPPLRQRGDDIERLAMFFLDQARVKYGRNMVRIGPEAMAALKSYAWPGNIRQLEYLIHQIVITHFDSELTVGMLGPDITGGGQPTAVMQEVEANRESFGELPSIQEMEKRMIVQSLAQTDGSVPVTAEQLGLSQSTLYRKIKKYGIQQ
ncbi:MAG: sigma-54-dependent transcriptional regulator [Planctomycetota bacterium]|jgi:DNA-binding NtrC family response regulator